MQANRKALLSGLLGLAVLLPGCVRLDGQRLSWFHDEAADVLQIVLNYDGVHDSGDDRHGRGVEQIPEFVRDDSVMLLDWPLHRQLKKMREATGSPGQSAHDNARTERIAELAKTVRVEPIGHYREPNGKLGAAQLITIPNAQSFVKTVNSLLNAQIVEDRAFRLKHSPEQPVPKTLERIETAAKTEHQWIRLDGQAIRVVVPVHPGEWKAQKIQFAAELAEKLSKGFGEKPDETRLGLQRFFRFVAASPLSYIERDDEIEIMVGRTKSATTLRATLRDAYEPSLEAVLVEQVPVDLDQRLADALLDAENEPSAPVAAVLKFGPPEDQVRALLVAFEKDDVERRVEVSTRLNRWAAEWNRNHVVPAAPTATTPDDDLAAWKQWYVKMRGL
ncbi:MAG TPA: hypothetical protein DD670_17935 [Planctomycetaceae bacterium]|nr:hypothetical protein [Planctomycetaceae bacterium]